MTLSHLNPFVLGVTVSRNPCLRLKSELGSRVKGQVHTRDLLRAHGEWTKTGNFRVSHIWHL